MARTFRDYCISFILMGIVVAVVFALIRMLKDLEKVAVIMKNNVMELK